MQVQFLAPTWLLRTICNSSPRLSNSLASGLFGHCMHTVHRYTCPQSTYVHYEYMQYSNDIPRSHFYLDFLTQPLWPALLTCLRLPPLEPHLTSSLSLNRLKLVPASGPLYRLFICNLCFSVSHSSLLLIHPPSTIRSPF